MRFALVWMSASISTITAIVAAEHAQSSTDRKSALFKFICAEEAGSPTGVEKQHPRTQTSRMLLPKGRENITPTWSGRGGYSHLDRCIFQGQANKEGPEILRDTSAASERHRPLHGNTLHKSSRAERGGLGARHDQVQLIYDRPSLKNISSVKDSLRNVDGDSVLYTPKNKHIDSVDALSWLGKPASLVGRERNPGDRSDSPNTRLQHKHPIVYQQQHLPEELHVLDKMELQDTYDPGSWQHQKRKAHPNGIEILVNGSSESFPSQGHYPSGSKDTPRQKPAALRTNYPAPADAMTTGNATPETHSLLTGRSEKGNHPQQKQREARQHNRDMMETAQGGKHSSINERQSTATARLSPLGSKASPEGERLPPLRQFIPFSEESNRNRESFVFSSSKKHSSLGSRQKAASTKDSLFGKADTPLKKRAERRSYRKRHDVNAVGSSVAASNPAGNASLHKRRDKTSQHNIHMNALSTSQYGVNSVGELPPMSKSVLDLGVDDLQMLADLLYDLKAAQYAQRLEAGSKRREVQEGMFFSKLKRIQERQKLQRRENELNDEKKLKSLEESLRFTKPLSAYHDLLLEGGTHKRGRKSGPGIRSHKDSDYKVWNRVAGEADHVREGTTVRRSPKKKGSWRDNRQKQMAALALIEREEQSEEGSGRIGRFRRRSARGIEGKEMEEGVYLGAESGNMNHTADSMFSAWEYVSTSPDKKDDSLSVVDDEDLRTASQNKKKRDAGQARTENKDRKTLVENHSEVEETTPAGRYAESSDQQEASAAPVEWTSKNAHVEAVDSAATGLHKNDTVLLDTRKDEQEKVTSETAKRGQHGGRELDNLELVSTDGRSTASGLLHVDAFSSAGAGVLIVEKEIGEVLSAVIDDDGVEKVLAEQISEHSFQVYQKDSGQRDAVTEGLQKGFAGPSSEKQVVRGNIEEKVHQGEAATSQADKDGLQKFDIPYMLPSDSTSQPSGQPPVNKQHVKEQDAGMKKAEDMDATIQNHEVTYDTPKPSQDFKFSNLSSAEASKTLGTPGLVAGLQDEDKTTEEESLEEGEKKREESVEDETVGEAPWDTQEGSLDEGEQGEKGSGEAKAVSKALSGNEGGSLEGGEEGEEESAENALVSEAPWGTLALADDFTVASEKDRRPEESEPEAFMLESLITTTTTNRTDQSQFHESTGRNSHIVQETSTLMETADNISEDETLSEVFEGKFRKGALMVSDTYASSGSAGLSTEAPRNDERPTTFNKRFEHTVDIPSSSPTEISLLSPSRLSRFRARHFRSDATGKPESLGKQTERFFDRTSQNRYGDKAHQALHFGREELAPFSYRRLQFTSKKKSVLDRNASARLEFVDNDHGSQFVNWRSIDGERMIEKLWVSSMEEAERHQRKQVQREIESAFANEFDAVRTKKQVLQALGVSTADEDESEQQLAQRYYSAMQAVLHGPEEEVLTGQAFGRYVPSTNQSFITDIRNRIIYGPWSVNWNRAITSRTQRVSVGSRRGAVSVGSSAASYVTTVNVNWGRVAVTFAARPNDQAVKVGVLRGRYGVDIARSNRLRTSAVETVMRYVESATVVDQINRTYGQRIRVRRFSFNYTRDFTLPAFDSPGRTPGLRQELGVNWGTVGISVGTDVPDSEYAVSVGLRGYQFSVLRDFFQRLIQAQGNWGRGWQFELAAKIEDPISPLIYYQFGFGRLGRLYSTAGAGVGGDNTPMALFQIQGDRTSVAFKALEQAGVRIFNIGFTVGRFTYSWDSVVNYDKITLPLSPISPILKALLHVTP